MKPVPRAPSFAGGLATALAVALLSVAAFAQNESVVYLFATDAKGTPLLDIKSTDLTISEDVGTSEIIRVSRTAWPLRLTVLVDNGPGTADALVHLRTGLTRLFDGIPSDLPVSLIATAPNPRWLVRESRDRVQITNAIGRLTPDDGLAQFSDALLEYSGRLDLEFRKVGAEVLQPYLPVLVSISTTNMDGSNVVRDNVRRMLESMRKHRVWTHMVVITPTRRTNTPGQIDNIGVDEGQSAEIARLVKEISGGTYTPITGSGTSALGSKLMPELAQTIALRYLRQMFQHRIVFQRPAAASGPMRKFSLALRNNPGARVLVSTDGSMP